MKKHKSGFTLTELLITLTIVAILVVIAVPVLSGLLNKSSDASEDVNAALYTSIMNKFAVEEVNEASSYPRLTAIGSDSEYAMFASKAGNGNYPGYNIIAGIGNADVLDEIRREAVIAIKAFSDTAVNDEYYIEPPADADYEYAYYYLTGEVKKVKRADMHTADGADLLNGNIDIEDYWVYLSRDGGSGAALGGISGNTGFLFVQVLQFGTGQPLDGARVTVTSGASTFTAITEDGQNGYVGFSGIPVGSVNVQIEYPGAISFPNRSYYSKSGEIIISNSGYEGCQLNVPYIVEMKLGSLGSLGFYEEKQIWEDGNWTTERDRITDSVTVTTNFTANGGGARSESYITNLYATNGTQELLTGEKYLTYGNYTMTASSYGYRTYSEAVVAKVYGIDNAAGMYSGFTSPYEYPILMKYPAGQSVVSGTIERESSSQPMQGTVSGLLGSWGYSDNRYVYARVKLTNTATRRVYYSDYFSYNSSGKHDYEITGLPDGTYKFEIDSPYGHEDLSEFPETVTVDGRHVEISGKVYKTEANFGYIEGTVTYEYSGNYDPVHGATVSFTRYGDSTSTVYTTTDEDGYYDVGNLRCGFYQMKVTLSSGLGGTTTYRKMFISGDECCDVQLSVPTVEVSGYVEPWRSSYEKVGYYGSLYDLEVVFTRTDKDGATTYSSMFASVTVESIDAYYSIDLVPGYYSVEITATCYEGTGIATTGFDNDTTWDHIIYVDRSDSSVHYGFYQNYDSYGHWQECYNCGEIFDYEDHQESSWTYYSSSYCYTYCTECGYDISSLTSHRMSSYVSKAATCTTTGSRVYYCSRGCGYSYTASISYSGHVGNGIWVYDSNGSSSSVGTHHQNCKNCGTTMNANTACTRGSLISNGDTNHYDSCSVCSGKRYSDHTWVETSRTGYVCTGGTVYYKCSGCGATKSGSYEATSAHNNRASCDTFHECSWNTECTAKGLHVWEGYYHILCTRCQAVHYNKWCAMHMGSVGTIFPCPY